MNKRNDRVISIYELETVDESYIKRIARLHIEAFPTFFLTQLGSPFLTILYTGYMEDSGSGIIVAENNGKLLGFIAYSKDYPRFYKGLIKHHLLKFAICSAGTAVRHPSFIKRILGAFKKSESVVKEEKYVELASICVNPQVEGRGVGSKLVKYLVEHTDLEKYAYINLETDADGNDAVNKFYVKNGFQLAGEFTTSEGRRMNEYRYYGRE